MHRCPPCGVLLFLVFRHAILEIPVHAQYSLYRVKQLERIETKILATFQHAKVFSHVFNLRFLWRVLESHFCQQICHFVQYISRAFVLWA